MTEQFSNVKVAVTTFLCAAVFFSCLTYFFSWIGIREFAPSMVDPARAAEARRLMTATTTKVLSSYYIQKQEEIVMLAEIDKGVEGHIEKVFTKCILGDTQYRITHVKPMIVNDWTRREFADVTHLSYMVFCQVLNKDYPGGDTSPQVKLLATSDVDGQHIHFTTKPVPVSTIPLTVQRPPGFVPTVAVCVATLDGGNGVHNIDTWLSHLKDAGVAHTYIYYESSFITAQGDRLFNGKHDIFTSNINWLPDGQSQSFYRAQHLALQDCLYRSKRDGYSHVLSIDTDEYYIGSQNDDYRASQQSNPTLVTQLASMCNVCCSIVRKVALEACHDDLQVDEMHKPQLDRNVANILGKERILFEQFPPKGMIVVDHFIDGIVEEHTVHGCSLTFNQANMDWSPIHQRFPPQLAFIAHMRGANGHNLDCALKRKAHSSAGGGGHHSGEGVPTEEQPQAVEINYKGAGRALRGAVGGGGRDGDATYSLLE